MIKIGPQSTKQWNSNQYLSQKQELLQVFKQDAVSLLQQILLKELTTHN